MRTLRANCLPAEIYFRPARSAQTIARVTRAKRKSILARIMRRLHCTRGELLALAGASAVLTMIAGGLPVVPTFTIFALGLMVARAVR